MAMKCVTQYGLRVTYPVTWNLSRAPVTNFRFFVTGPSFSLLLMEMSRVGAAGLQQISGELSQQALNTLNRTAAEAARNQVIVER